MFLLLFIFSLSNNLLSQSSKDSKSFSNHKPDNLLNKNPGGVNSDLVLWLKADEGCNTLIDGDNVTSWSDQSVNAFSANADINATDYPLYQSNSVNFNPGIEFDGTYTDDYSDGLHLGDDYIYSNNSGKHIFIVCNTDTDIGTDKYVFDFGLQANGGYGMIYSSNDYGVCTNNIHGGANSELFHSMGDDPAIVESRITFNSNQAFYRNGTKLAEIPITLSELTSFEVNEQNSYGPSASFGPVSIGRKSASVYLSNDGGRIFDGQINEVLVYNDILSNAEIIKVESYLAVKYGITLNHDYLSSNDSVIKSISGSYIHDIVSIGRDDNSELNQKQSKNISDDAIITLGLKDIESNNQLNPNVFSADGQFLICANDNASSIAFWNTIDVSIFNHPGEFRRINRAWQITKTGDVADILFQVEMDNPAFDIEDLAVDSDGSYYLLIDDDGDFTNGGTSFHQMELNSGSKWQVELEHVYSSYFTIGMKVMPGPEICNNGLDDDNDFYIDCDDNDCSTFAGCPDNDLDGISDPFDSDDDNDGISDCNEASGSLNNDRFGWTYNTLSGTSSMDEISDSGIVDWIATSFSDISSSGLTINTPSSYSTISGISSSTLPDAITNSEYISVGFHTGNGLINTAIIDGMLGLNNNDHDSYYGAFLISDDGFSTYYMLSQEIYFKGDISGYKKVNIVQQPFPLKENTTYEIRAYLYNLVDDSPLSTVVWDDLRFYVSGCHADDFDGDGINNHFDLDSDNDGVTDILENYCNRVEPLINRHNGGSPYFLDGSPGINDDQDFLAEWGLDVDFNTIMTNAGSATSIN